MSAYCPGCINFLDYNPEFTRSIDFLPDYQVVNCKTGRKKVQGVK